MVWTLFIGDLCVADVGNRCDTEGIDSNGLSFMPDSYAAHFIVFCHRDRVLCPHP